MKSNKIFFLLIAVFFVLVFMYQYFLPEKFVWTETYNRYDKQPFGSYVFDDVVSSSVDNYMVMDMTLYRYYYDFLPDEYYDEDDLSDFEEDTVVPLPPEERCALLITNNYARLSNEDITALMYLLRQGNKVMLCMESFPYNLCDSFYFRCVNRHHNYTLFLHNFEQSVLAENRRDSLFFGTDPLHPEHIYKVFPYVHRHILRYGELSSYDSDTAFQMNRILSASAEALVRDDAGDTVALRLSVGEGELFLVSTPLMFTNYGMLDGDNASYAFRLLSYMKDMPLIRLGAYNEEYGKNSTSSLRYILRESSLRWALFISLIAIVLFMIFTAKRRQRVIPVIRPPANETLRFTCLIANLYYQRKDYKDMLKKKYLYFCAELKRTEGLDLRSDESDEELCKRLAEKTRQNYAGVWPTFRELKYLLRDEATVDENAMIRHINQMNEWMQFLN
jgi:hypothetical protein